MIDPGEQLPWVYRHLHHQSDGGTQMNVAQSGDMDCSCSRLTASGVIDGPETQITVGLLIPMHPVWEEYYVSPLSIYQLSFIIIVMFYLTKKYTPQVQLKMAKFLR